VTRKATAPRTRSETLFRKLDKVLKQVSSKAVPEAVHQLRTTVRRIETLVAARDAGQRRNLVRLGKRLARLRRRAGKVRDIDVQIVALRGIRLETDGRDRAVLVRHLNGIRSRREKKLLDTLEEELASGLQKYASRGQELLSEADQSATSKDYAAEALCKFRDLAQNHPPFTEANLHDFRMDCKRMRYLAEITGDTPAAQAVVAELKRIQDAIGEWHDWLTLGEVADEVIPNANSPLLSALRAQRRVKFSEALHITAEAKEKLLNLAEQVTAAQPEPAEVPRKGPRAVVEIGSRKTAAS
jgi:CHAD domain-containing protein